MGMILKLDMPPGRTALVHGSGQPPAGKHSSLPGFTAITRSVMVPRIIPAAISAAINMIRLNIFAPSQFLEVRDCPDRRGGTFLIDDDYRYR